MNERSIWSDFCLTNRVHNAVKHVRTTIQEAFTEIHEQELLEDILFGMVKYTMSIIQKLWSPSSIARKLKKIATYERKMVSNV